MADLDGNGYHAITQELSSGSLDSNIGGSVYPAIVEEYSFGSMQIGAVEGVEVIASDMLELRFDRPMRRTTALMEPTNYTVTPDGAGNPVAVRAVRAKLAATVVRVFLVVSKAASVGETYTVTVSESLRTHQASALHSRNLTGQYIARRTKVDDMLESRPPLYRGHGTAPGAVMRGLLQAIGNADDDLGGSRSDTLP